MKRPLTGFLISAALLSARTVFADDGLTYYIPFERALEIVPQDRTLHYSEELRRDLTQFPIPWEEQVRNAVTNAGGSDTRDFIGGTKYWVPFDPIPGEESYPMQRRLFLNAQRGYQRAVIHDMVAFEELQAEYSVANDEIVDRYRAESDASLNDVLASLRASQDEITTEQKSRNQKKARREFYERECLDFFPDDAGGCGVFGHSIVAGDSLFNVPLLKASPDGEGLKAGDVFVTTPNGRVVARINASYWVEWYRYDGTRSGIAQFSWGGASIIPTWMNEQYPWFAVA